MFELNLNTRWYVRQDDVLGGVCIMNHPDISPSQIDYRPGDPSGHMEAGIGSITDFLTDKAAEHIVLLHNEWYEEVGRHDDDAL